MHLSHGQLPLPLENVGSDGYLRPGRRSRYAAVLAYIQEHPGTWVCIDTRQTLGSASMLAANIRRGKPAQLAGLDATVRYGYQVWCRLPVPDATHVDA